MLAALATGATIWGLLQLDAVKDFFFNDDDRPPIIVRGGSLHFDNGFPGSRPGKRWYEEGEGTGRWSMDHPSGKPVRVLHLYFVGAPPNCLPVTTDGPIRIEYDAEGDGTFTEYVIEIAQTGKPRPVVVGPALTRTTGPGNTSDAGLQTGEPGKGTLGRVFGNGFDCAAPEQVWIESVR